MQMKFISEIIFPKYIYIDDDISDVIFVLTVTKRGIAKMRKKTVFQQFSNNTVSFRDLDLS